MSEESKEYKITKAAYNAIFKELGKSTKDELTSDEMIKVYTVGLKLMYGALWGFYAGHENKEAARDFIEKLEKMAKEKILNIYVEQGKIDANTLQDN